MTSRHSSKSTQEPSGRRVRKQTRTPHKRRRSVGADVLAMPASRAAGLSSKRQRPHGRGETVRRVERDREQGEGAYTSRPAVYTRDKDVPKYDLPEISFSKLGLNSVPWKLLAAIAVLGVAIALVMGPGRMCYVSWREHGALQARLDAVTKQNAELNDQIDRLQSIEGIEDEARRRGYVYPGEESLVVKNLEEEQVADPAAVDRAVQDYESNVPWYIHLLDAIFGYSANE